MAGTRGQRWVSEEFGRVSATAFNDAFHDAPCEIATVEFDTTQEVHLATVVEVLQSIKQSEMSPMLGRIYKSEGGMESLDVLMKYMYDFSYNSTIVVSRMALHANRC